MYKNGIISRIIRASEKAEDLGEVPVGAVIAHGDRIISCGYNMVETLKDPTAHAEIIAITSACNRLQSKNLKNCSIYVTLEPCIMCFGAIIKAHISNLFYITTDPQYGFTTYTGPKHNIKIEKIYLPDDYYKAKLDAFFRKIREKHF